MEMRLMQSGGYHENARKAREVLRTHREVLKPDQKVWLQRKVTKDSALRALEGRAGRSLKVFNSEQPTNVVAFINMDSREIAIGEHMLGTSFATYAIEHELMHDQSGFKEIDLENNLAAEQVNALQEHLEILDLKEINLLEGFNDLATISEVGQNNHSGYLDEEVPAAEKIERLCKKVTGVSLLEAYKAGDQMLFYDRLKILCDMLAVKNWLKMAA